MIRALDFLPLAYFKSLFLQPLIFLIILVISFWHRLFQILGIEPFFFHWRLDEDFLALVLREPLG
jgi:hypothetical protein